MRLQVFSDIHTEHYGDPFRLLPLLDSRGVDILVLAGDIICLNPNLKMRSKGFDWLERLATRYYKDSDIVIVSGNHEFYGSKKDELAPYVYHQAYKDFLAQFSNVHYLDNETKTVRGQRFLGGTMWFPEPRDPMWIFHRKLMWDFSEINDCASLAFSKNDHFKSEYMGVKPDDVVVTHHLPSGYSIDPYYKGHALNDFFLSDMQSFFDRNLVPKLWIHGHTHSPCDYTDLGFRVFCNPIGYPRENAFSNDTIKQKLNKYIEI